MNWTDEYREIVEFYYWEPQHIGRAKGEKRFASADEMYAHVNKLEVSLNHVLNIFFSLYPLSKLDCFGADNSHEMVSAWQLETLQREQKNATQPDMFFQGKNKNIAIELKLDSKCTKEQVIKYVKFNEYFAGNTQKEFELVLLTPYSEMKRIFKEKYESSVDLITDVGIKLNIKVVTYKQLYDSLLNTKNNEIESKLVAGLVKYLNKRPEIRIEAKS